jgi:16S rRNA (uracil1498-N3)-methyltransferase
MHRFFIPPDQIDDNQAIITDATAHQIRNVLRMEVGQHIVVLDNLGSEYELELAHLDRKQVIGKVVERRPSAHEPRTHITLYQSLMKRDKFEWVLQKATEVGVSCFVPVITQRSLVQTADLKANKQDRWQRILTEAAEQSHRARIPELLPPLKFSQAVTQCPNYQLALIAWEEGGVDLKTAVSQPTLAASATSTTIALFIGPEGGYDPSEVQLAQQHGAIPMTLGARILRAETAAIVTPALILHELENSR